MEQQSLTLNVDAIAHALRITEQELTVLRTLALCNNQEPGAFIRESLLIYAQGMLDNPEFIPRALAQEMIKLLET